MIAGLFAFQTHEPIIQHEQRGLSQAQNIHQILTNGLPEDVEFSCFFFNTDMVIFEHH